jgi:hypothetical protein
MAKARYPDRLRFGVCCQYGPEMTGSEELSGSRFAVNFVDWRLSKGVCWARAEVMKLYQGEDWYLQLDSHHRFACDWDEKLVEQAGLTGSNKPVLSTYAAGFRPGSEADAAEQVTTMEFDCFTREGVLLPKPALCVGLRSGPIRARFVSAHLLFAPGTFVHEVPYDPELYFLGEEITLAVRAFTHGYDLFHPARHVVWHDYTRVNRPNHWGDHTHEAGCRVAWHDRDADSLAKAGRFLTSPWEGRDGVGGVRSVADYEDYAGVSFRHHRVQEYTRLNKEPPNPPAEPDWAELTKEYRIEITLETLALPEAATKDPALWYVGFHDNWGHELYRCDASVSELAHQLDKCHGRVRLVRQFTSAAVPASWTVWPLSMSVGWLDPITRKIP